MKSSIKRVSITFITLFVLFSPIQASGFYEDIVKQSLFYDSIFYFYDTYPILNKEKTKFEPLNKVTKAEFFKLLLNSGGYVAENNGYNELPYKDTINDSWYAPYIKKSLDIGLIVFDDQDPFFQPGNTLTREEGFKLIVKFYGIPMPLLNDNHVEFIDVESSTPLAPMAKIIYEYSLLPDPNSIYLWPYKELTRADMVTVLHKIHTEYRSYRWQDTIVESIAGEELSEELSSDITEVKNFDVFLEVWDEINTNYIYKDDLNQEELLYSAINGLVSGLEDPYSEYFIPSDAIDYFEELEGEFEGIGIYLLKEDDAFIILSPLKNSPAEEEGLLPQDEIIEVDEKTIKGMDLQDVIDLISGPSGSIVSLKIKRDNEILEFEIKREKIELEFVETEKLNNDTALIVYSQFSGRSNVFFDQKINQLIEEGYDKFILDLRNNPGGYLESAQAFLSNFIDQGQTVVKLEYSDGSEKSYDSVGPANLKELEMVILINEGSASAAEIVALTLQELEFAQIVGTFSYGKGKVQEISVFDDGSTLKLSNAIWTSPSGESIDLKGVTPNYLIDDNQYTENDEQVDKAFELLN